MPPVSNSAKKESWCETYCHKHHTVFTSSSYKICDAMLSLIHPNVWALGVQNCHYLVSFIDKSQQWSGYFDAK